MEQAMTEREIETIVREVTDEEVAFYHEYGWVMMPRLVAPEFAGQLLRVGQEWVDRNAQEVGHGNPRAGLARNQETEPFRSFMFSERMAQNATRLVNRKRFKGEDVPLRYRVDISPKQAPWSSRGRLSSGLIRARLRPSRRAPILAGAGGSHTRDGCHAVCQPLPSRRTAGFGVQRRPGRPAQAVPQSDVRAGTLAALPLPAGRLHRASRLHRPRRPGLTPPTSRAGPISSRTAPPTPATGTAAPPTGAVSGSA